MTVEILFSEILIGLSVCHFLGDFTWLSTPWMLSAKAKGEPLLPIFVHATVHAVLMTIFVKIYLGDIATPILLMNVFILQSVSHFLIDTLKGKINVWFPSVQSQTNKWHWVVFGFDQFLHQLVNLGITYFIVQRIF